MFFGRTKETEANVRNGIVRMILALISIAIEVLLILLL